MEKVNLNNNPLISIVIPTYNRKEMLLQALQSVKSQKYKNIEIIVIDDNSSDDTFEYFSQDNNLDIIYKRNDGNKGPGYSRKLGYEISHGEYIIFMDDDDYYTDIDFFNKAIKIYNENLDNNLSFVSGNSEIKYEYNNSLKEKKMNVEGLIDQTKYLNNFQFKYNKPNSTFTTIFSKEKLESVDFKSMQMVNDSSIYLRALLAGNAYIMKDFIGVYRIHDKNISSSIKADFLVENLKEKKYIYEQIKAKGFNIDLLKWWYQQVFITVDYFISDTKPNLKSFMFVYKWCLDNTYENSIKNKFATIFLGKYIKIILKKIIKKVLRRSNEI